jgi:triacylglycerol esterase/lipase EstA (alpha/beta hydrolase family)
MVAKTAQWTLFLCLCALFSAASASASAQYAPLGQPGPPLSVAPDQLASALVCSPNVGRSHREPVLFVPGTGETFPAFFQWSYANELSNLGIPWCGISPPYRQLGDVQIGGEYDAYAIRTLYRRSGDRKIAIVGHSQGGMQPRWALRFWPDTRAMVADDIGIAPDNQGTTNGRTLVDVCAPAGDCPLNFWQQATGSHFIQALNSRQQMFTGIDYTVIYSTTDSVVLPQDTPLDGAGSYRRIALQSICPADFATHFQDGTTDPVSWALTLDAITLPGPADPARIPQAVCRESLPPGMTPEAAAVGGSQAALSVTESATTAPTASAEPPLACYVYAHCQGRNAPTLRFWKHTTPRLIQAGHRALIHMLVRTDEGGVLVPAPAVRITLGRQRRLTDGDGDATIAIRLIHPGSYRLIASRPGCNPARATIDVR